MYVDTSGVLAFLDGDDLHHDRSRRAWEQAMESQARMIMTEYVRLESWSLIQRRLGLDAVQDFHQVLLPMMEVVRVDEPTFDLLCRQVLLSKRRKLSLVDLSSFDCMQTMGIEHALAFDKHFNEMGFQTPQQDAWTRGL